MGVHSQQFVATPFVSIELSLWIHLFFLFWSFNFSPPQSNRLALLNFELSNQLSKLRDVPRFLSFMKIWAFQGLWDLSEIQASCLFTLLMFVSWFFGTTYFSCFSSWFHDCQASCLSTLVLFISWFLSITLFSCSSSYWFHEPHNLLLLFIVGRYVGNFNTPPKLGHCHLLLGFL